MKQRKNWEWYELKYELAAFIIPKLEKYKSEYNENGVCIPDWVNDERKKEYSDTEITELQLKWNSELDDMILSFKQILNYTIGGNDKIGYDETIIQNGLDKFSKHFQHFWD